MGDFVKDVIIIGAGPSGLATAIAAEEAGLDYEVLEKGTLVESIFRFPPGMTFFTTPELLEIGGLPFVTPYEKPTRGEALKYYRRVAETYKLRIVLGVEVLAVRPIAEGFAVETRSEPAPLGERHARTVVMATGYYDHPNLLGIPGEELPHVSHYYTEAHGYYRKKVVVVGGKNSAAIAALELYRGGAQVTLVHRHAALSPSIKYWIRPDIENRIKEGTIAARFESRVVEIRPEAVVIETGGRREELSADAVLLLTGYHPDADLLRGAGVRVDDTSYIPAHDPETLETNVPGLYLAGAVVSGKETGRIFIENGRFHGEAVVRAIQRRLHEPATAAPSRAGHEG
jgi:thioredoxin reductase (NADPH)